MQPVDGHPAIDLSPAPVRILVRGVNWLGDAVMTTPALQRLREAFPQAHIAILSPAKLKDLWTHHPTLNQVHTFERGETAWRIGRRLRNERFDLGLVLPNSPRSALEVWLAGATRRVGYRRPWRNWLLTDAIPPRMGVVTMRKRGETEVRQLAAQNPPPARGKFPPESHHSFEYLHLVAGLGGKPQPVAPKLVIPDRALHQFRDRFKLAVEPGETPLWLGLNPGAEYGPAKRWPEERFVEAAISIQRRIRCRWLVFGVQADNDLCLRIATEIYRATEAEFGPDKVAERPHVINLAGQTSLRELCAGLKLCQALLTNDSGSMHVASALGTPVVSVFGSTSPELTGPGLPGQSGRHDLIGEAPCAPCFLRTCPVDFRCMRSIRVDQAVEAMTQAAAIAK